jgi:hypothetical protein
MFKNVNALVVSMKLPPAKYGEQLNQQLFIQFRLTTKHSSNWNGTKTVKHVNINDENVKSLQTCLKTPKYL